MNVFCAVLFNSSFVIRNANLEIPFISGLYNLKSVISTRSNACHGNVLPGYSSLSG